MAGVMSKQGKWIIASVAVLVIATLALWIGRGTSSRVQPEQRAKAEETRAPDELAVDGLATATSDSAPSRIDAARSVPADHARDDASTVIIEVVRDDTHSPLPGALVHFWPKRAFDGTNGVVEEWLRRSTIEDHASEAVEVHADERGIARLSDTTGGGMLVGAADGVWGGAPLEKGVTRVTLRLAPDTSLSVRVVDTNGSPVPDTTVALRQPGHGAHTDLLTARTGADGVAILRHAGLWWSTASSSASGFEVLVPGLLDPPCARALDRTQRTSEPIELVLQPNGSCSVEIVDEQGRALPASFSVRTCLAGAESVCETTDVPSPDGVVVEHVELGRRLACKVDIEGAAEPAIVTGEGPRRPGERVRFRARAPLEGARVIGRIVGPSNVPLGGLTLNAWLESPAGERLGDASFTTRTNETGRFVLALRDLLATKEDVRLAIRAPRGKEGAGYVAHRQLPADFPRGSFDVGDVTLEEAPVVASGIVVDALGNALPDALLTLLIPLSAPSSEPMVQVRGDDEGRFALHSATDADDVAVLASKAGYVDRTEHTRRGARTLRIVMQTAGSLGGRVLLDPSFAKSLVLVDAVRSADVVEATLRPTFLQPDGSFTLRDLGEGEYSVRVTLAATASVIGRIEGVKVESERTTRDARLDPLDLRASHRMIWLELCDDRGALLGDGTCSVRPADEPGSPAVVTHASEGRAALLYSGRPLDVTVWSNGFLPTHVERVSDSRRVTLQSAGKLRLELARDPGLAPPLRLVARVSPLDGGPGSATLSRMGTFDSAGVLILESAFTGDARVDLQVVASDARDPRIEPLTPSTIRLAAQAQEQVFRLDFDPAELARALELLRGER